MVAAGICDQVLVQVSYAIGVVEPTSINIDTYQTSKIDLTDGEISKRIEKIFDMRPGAIERRLKLRNPIYSETAAYGHMGRTPRTIVKHFSSPYSGERTVEVELFTWENLDYVERLKNEFDL
jgi:S-adenosylmethionine synthetase